MATSNRSCRESRSQNSQSICEIGGGANPLLALETVQEHRSEYTILDISVEELAKAPDGYQKVVADIARPLDMATLGNYDVVFSQFLAEHVKDAEQFLDNSNRLLKVGGCCIHIFPTLYYPWFVLNAAVPDNLANRVLVRLQPRRELGGKHGKFPAYYRGCRGPIGSQLRLYANHGFAIEEFHSYYGSLYLSRVPKLMALEERFAHYLCERRISALTSYALVVLRKIAKHELCARRGRAQSSSYDVLLGNVSAKTEYAEGFSMSL